MRDRPQPSSGRIARAAVLVALTAMWLAACGGAAATTMTATTSGASSDPAGGGGSPTGTDATAASPAQKLTPAELAGARVIYSYAGLQPPASMLRQIRAGKVGGVIFFGSNIQTLDQIHGVIEKLQQAAKASPLHLPLLLMTDQEGGQVRRLPGAPVRSEKQIGESADADKLATGAGRAAGKLLREVGMNVNLAPVLDVYRTPGDFDDQFGRSYSSDPSKVATLGARFVKAQQATGTAATVKHFPGLGAAAASQNTDEGPVTLNVSLTKLRSVDERPFQAAIKAGAKLVMSSWAVYPALDGSRPAGLSSKWIGSELRGRLGFRGVTITDSIAAGALTSYGSIGNRAVLAANAGADLILCGQPSSGAEGASVVRALAHAIMAGKLDREATDAAVNRIIALRRNP